ncbi:MAG: NAD-dependent epimerase/dehydratase family protein, partial [Deltaproteobacteria bacterium]
MSDVGGREAADRVVVTGGTGLVGRRLVDDLRESGVAVTVLSRGAAGVLPTGVTRVAVAYDRGIDPELLADAGSLVHLAGAGVADGRWTPARRRVIRDSRVESARALVRAIADLPQARRPRALVSASAVGIYGDRGDEILTEASDPGSGFLAEVCKEWEASVLAAGRLGVRVAVLRFGMVLARDGGALTRLVPLFRFG